MSHSPGPPADRAGDTLTWQITQAWLWLLDTEPDDVLQDREAGTIISPER